MTVRGPIRPGRLGMALTHEHALVDFIGADRVSPDRYDSDEAFKVILPHLLRVKAKGCRGFVDCTPAYLGRDPLLLRRLAVASGLNILTNTGYYGASDNKFLPRHAWTESAEQLAGRWVDEWQNGIEGTGVRPGFIKIGVGGENLSELHSKLVRAAGVAHRQTGLTIASHTGPAKLALEQLKILGKGGVGPAAFIWVHAQAERDLDNCLQIAERGCWISFDGFSAAEVDRYLAVCKQFRHEGRIKQLLLSHDAGWFRPGEPKGGQFRPYGDLFEILLPRLREVGFSRKDIHQVMVANPAAAFSVSVRSGIITI